MEYNPQDIEKKWQEVWENRNVAHTEVDKSKKKFYMVFAYPYPTGFLHTGHMRGYSCADMIIRYHKLIGENVFFPTGIHATGNGAIAKAQAIQKGDDKYINYLKENGTSDEEIEKMKDPYEFIRFFAHRYMKDYKSFGFLVDDRPFLTTIDKIYNRFITWQFLRLGDKGLLKQGEYYATYCEHCGPVAVDPSESDISKGGHAEKNEYTLLKFSGDIPGFGKGYLIAATLRPETVYGQTNLWIKPDQEYDIIKIKKNGELWVGCQSFSKKLKYQFDCEVVGKINSNEIIGKEFIAPGVDRPVPVLPAVFIDMDMGSGIVTSVPSDAPHDYAALVEIKDNCEKYNLCDIVKDIEPIPIIKTEGMADMPAVEICNKLGIRTSDDQRLEQAKKEVYKAGYYKGVMVSGPYKGMKVEDAKEKIKSDLIKQGKADIFFDLSEEVICRCGGKVYIKKVDHQWFIDYGKDWLNKNAIEHAKGMKIKPDDYYQFLPEALEWFKERPCARMGRWMGTPLPQDNRYTIEAISDSTMYPLFFIVSKYQKQFTEDQLTPEFFDYVFTGKGDAASISKQTGMNIELINKIKDEVDYWYPLDLNLGGKEHRTVHFPPFIKAHVAILPKDKWPRGIFVHGWVTSNIGDKVSKSKGGAEPVPKMIKRYGADVMRLYYANAASPFSDMAFNQALIETYKSRLNQMITLIEDITNITENKENEYIDKWIDKKLNSHIINYTNSMDNYDIKKASDISFFMLPNDVEWYVKRGGRNAKLLKHIANVIVQMMSPVTPHLAEELWHTILNNDELVTTSLLPRPKTEEIEEGYDSEEYLRSVMNDISKIINITKIKPNKMYIYTCAGWKYNIVKDSLNINMQRVIPTLMKKDYGIPKDVQVKFVKSLAKKIGDYRSLPKDAFELDENEILKNAKDFISQKFNTEVEILNEDNAEEKHRSKAQMSAPLKPGIVIE